MRSNRTLAYAILTVAALADGLVDAAILVRSERVRKAEQQSSEWIAWQMQRVNTGLDRLEQTVDGFGDTIDLRHVAVASALALALSIGRNLSHTLCTL